MSLSYPFASVYPIGAIFWHFNIRSTQREFSRSYHHFSNFITNDGWMWYFYVYQDRLHAINLYKTFTMYTWVLGLPRCYNGAISNHIKLEIVSVGHFMTFIYIFIVDLRRHVTYILWKFTSHWSFVSAVMAILPPWLSYNFVFSPFSLAFSYFSQGIFF